MLTFWDTVRGTQLADTLIRELPRLNEKRPQEVIEASAAKEEIEKGARFVGAFSSNGEDYVVIERRAR